MSITALIVAAGRGVRAGDGLPKPYRVVAGQTILERTLRTFLAYPEVDRTVVVIHPDDRDFYRACVARLGAAAEHRLGRSVAGGETRQNSVRLGLEALAPNAPDVVLIHDAARPFVDGALIGRSIAAGRAYGAAVPGSFVTDTIKLVDGEGRVLSTPERGALRAIQTPQAFRFDLLREAHEKAAAADLHAFTDDGALMEWAGLPVHVFPGDEDNVKLTRGQDFESAEHRLRENSMTYLVRVGTGFDVHAFGDGDHVWLGGVKVSHDRSAIAHSDGDVILHALTDAVLGALADGDIGMHFPPTDPQWRGVSSDRFLAHAVALVRGRGGLVDHLDATLICERPKLGPHRETIRNRIAEIAGLRVDQVSVKATTTERLGFTGRGEGIAATAAATIRLPETKA